MNHAKITIYDIAAQAGVSTGTVSKVINHGDGVRPATALLVRQTMAALGYEAPPPGQRRGYRRPDRKRRTNRLALIVPGMMRSVFQSPVYMDVQHGIERGARAHGQAMLLSHIPYGAPLPLRMVPEKIDGAIVFGWSDEPRLLRQLQGLPVVRVMGIVEPFAGYDHVTYDNQAIGGIAGDYLLRKGHFHCGFIGSITPEGLFGERGAGFARCLAAAGGTVQSETDDRLAIITPDMHRGDRDRLGMVLDRLLAGRPRPTGLFVPSDMLTAAAYPLLYERGMIPGQDIDVVSCNNEELLLGNLHPRPAAIDIHAELVGFQAVEQLLWRLENPAAPRAVVKLEPSLVPGAG